MWAHYWRFGQYVGSAIIWYNSNTLLRSNAVYQVVSEGKPLAFFWGVTGAYDIIDIVLAQCIREGTGTQSYLLAINKLEIGFGLREPP